MSISQRFENILLNNCKLISTSSQSALTIQSRINSKNPVLPINNPNNNLIYPRLYHNTLNRMDNLNGIKLQIHDMKREGQEILYFKQLQQSAEKNGREANAAARLNEELFKKFDYLLVTPDNELLGIKAENSELLLKADDAYKLAQGMFISG